MKKNIFMAALCAVTLTVGAAVFASCGNTEIPSDDEDIYWHHCTYTAAEEATCQSEGSIGYYFCDRCDGYFYSEHDFGSSDPDYKVTEDGIDESRLTTSKTPHDYGADGVCRMCGEKGSYTASEGLKYELNEEESGNYYSVKSAGTCTDEVIVIPSTYNSLPVLKIDEEAFSEKTMRAVIIPEGVTEIGEFAFGGCKNLESVFIPNSVTKIASGAFQSTPRLGIVENYIKYVDNWAVQTNSNDCGSSLREGTVGVASSAGSGLTGKVTLPDSLKYINEYAFSGCDITILTMGDGVEEIGSYAFEYAYSLESINFGKNLKTIGEGAFYHCNILQLTLPEGVTEIGDCAFEECSKMLIVTIPSTVTKIGAKAFKNCEDLLSAVFKDTEGWTSDGAAIDSSVLANTTKAANLLTTTLTEWVKE